MSGYQSSIFALPIKLRQLCFMHFKFPKTGLLLGNGPRVVTFPALAGPCSIFITVAISFFKIISSPQRTTWATQTLTLTRDTFGLNFGASSAIQMSFASDLVLATFSIERERLRWFPNTAKKGFGNAKHVISAGRALSSGSRQLCYFYHQWCKITMT